MYLVPDGVYKKKDCIKELCKTLNYVEFHIHAEKDNLCFYKNSANQTLIFISSKVVYFKKHFTYLV